MQSPKHNMLGHKKREPEASVSIGQAIVCQPNTNMPRAIEMGAAQSIAEGILVWGAHYNMCPKRVCAAHSIEAHIIVWNNIVWPHNNMSPKRKGAALSIEAHIIVGRTIL